MDNLEIARSIKCNVEDAEKLLNISNEDFKMITQNIRSIYSNFDDLLVTLNNFKFCPSIIILTECWLSEHKSIPAITNYVAYSTTRYLNKSDGVVAYVKNDLAVNVKEILLHNSSCLQIEIETVIILAIYRSPNTNTDIFINSLNDHLESLSICKNIILSGDININIISRDSEQSLERNNRLKYLDMLGTHSVMMGHCFPTREDSSLDHMMLKITHDKVAQVAVLNTTITDHTMVLLHITNAKPQLAFNKTKSVVNFEKALIDFKNKNIYELLLCNDPNILTELLLGKLMQSLKDNTRLLHVPKCKRVIKPWMTLGVLRCIRHRNNLQQKLRQNPDDEILRISYRRYRNYCKNLVRNLKRKYEKKLLEVSVGDSRNLWKNVAKVTYRKHSKTNNTKLLQVGPCAGDSVDQVNSYFSCVGKNLANAIVQPNKRQFMHNFCTNSQTSSFALYDTDIEEVHSILMALKSNSAPGWDNVPTSLLKLAKAEIVPVLCHLVNLCFRKGIFPSLLKESLVTPVYKSGDEEDINNYRPISVLPVISKVIEKLINKRLISFLNKFNILSSSQFGFQAGKSTEDAVEALTSVVVENLDKKSNYLAVFLDLKKAFDTVSIPILLQKLENCGIRGVPLDLLKSYMTDRTQRVKIGSYVSQKTSVTYGVPQGSVLGPTLFLIYINELCNMKIPHASIFSYADDTAIVFTGDSLNNLKINTEYGLAVISQWLSLNLLTLNTSKTNYILFSIKNSLPDFPNNIKIHSCQPLFSTNCNCPTITRLTSTKYLGVLVDQRLSWLSHVELVAGRLRKLMWIFKTLRHVANKKLLDQIYIALAQSILIYCITIWGGAVKTHFIQLERAQRGLLKIMYFKTRQFSTNSLFLYADLLTVRKLYILHVVLKKHMSFNIDTNILTKRRKDRVATLNYTKTKFARNQYKNISSYLYNKINKILDIYPMTYRNCKQKLTEWLKTLEYIEVENLLKLEF